MSFWGKFSWPAFVEVLPAYVAAFATVSAVAVAYYQISAARREASERDALKSLDSMSSSKEWQTVRTEFIKLRTSFVEGKISVDEFAKAAVIRDFTNEDFKRFYPAFRSIMNYYELTAIGIKRGAFSEAIYREYMKATLFYDWQVVFPIVEEIREAEAYPAAFENVEWLIDRWKSDVEREPKLNVGGTEVASSESDENQNGTKTESA